MMMKELKAVYENKWYPELQLKNRKITCSEDGYQVFRALYENEGDADQVEGFYALYLNQANQVVSWHLISKGGIASTVVDPKVVYSKALLCGACSIISCHNHPSGNLKPSEADISLTRKLKEAGKLLEIAILDHIILAPQDEGDFKYFSFADEGMI